MNEHLMAIPGTTVRIVARRNGVGLDRDVDLLRTVLPPESEVEHHSVRSWLPIRERFLRLGSQTPPKKSLDILVERVPWAWSHGLGTKVLVPNQERFPERHLSRLKRIDAVLCKSRHAENIFQKHARRAIYIGFTSVDRLQPDCKPDYGKFLHLAGRSTLKGTEMLLQLWGNHPEWPSLTLIQHPDNAPTSVPANVHLIVDYLEDSVLQQIQNEHGIHLCPSLSEGWGHYIVEGMSCRSVVVTTDGPPMNELVDSSRGFVVPWHESEPRHLGTNFKVSPQAMEQTIETILASSTQDLQQLGDNAREWFQQNQIGFQDRARDAFELLLAE